MEDTMAENEGSSDVSLKDDLLWGAKALGQFLGCSERKIFYYKEKKILPLGTIGSQIFGFKSRLRHHISGQIVEAE
jgi:hypothetical protein